MDKQDYKSHIRDMDKLAFKQQVKDAGLTVLLRRIHTAGSAMQQAQDSANQEDKSSAGDKYETARAMGQLDRDMNARQLAEAHKEYAFLQNVDVSKFEQAIIPGSACALDEQMVFIGCGLGAIEAAGQSVIMLSARSPLYEQLKGKRQGETVMFQGRQVVIKAVF